MKYEIKIEKPGNYCIKLESRNNWLFLQDNCYDVSYFSIGDIIEKNEPFEIQQIMDTRPFHIQAVGYPIKSQPYIN